ncbi:MAG: transcription termination/antitermination protein NusG [Elusimicrobiota bacterium]
MGTKKDNMNSKKDKNNSNAKARWYVVNTYTGQEEKVISILEKMIKDKGLEDKIFDTMIPRKEVVTLRQGKKKVVEKDFFPGYILVNMIVDDSTYWAVKNVQGVTDFLGEGDPVPLTKKEFQKIVDMVEQKKGQVPQAEVTFKKGDQVRIVEGPFDNFMGLVEDADNSKQKVKVMVTIFGRTTPVELDFLQVEKI